MAGMNATKTMALASTNRRLALKLDRHRTSNQDSCTSFLLGSYDSKNPGRVPLIYGCIHPSSREFAVILHINQNSKRTENCILRIEVPSCDPIVLVISPAP
jgi:hypothetical protein